MTAAHRDPTLKQTIHNRVFMLLYTPADNQMFDRLRAIIEKNTPLVGGTHLSLMYKAVNYSCDPCRILPRPRNQLHVSLEGLMQEYLADMEELRIEKPLVSRYLVRLLNTSDHPLDWQALLIHALQGPVRDLLAENSVELFTAPRISSEQAAAFQAANQQEIRLCKTRLVTNLITT
jgi:hypothetical protein